MLWLGRLELNRWFGGKAMTETMWKCDQVRAGTVVSTDDVRPEGPGCEVCQRMQQMVPIRCFLIEAIGACRFWN